MTKQFYVFLLIPVFFILTTQAQETITPAGDFYQSESLSLSWTLGQTAIETFEAGGFILTQGFQQSYLTVVATEEYPNADLQITVFPNPVSDLLNISITDHTLQNSFCIIYDFSGKVVTRQDLSGSTHEISFRSMDKGVYFLSIYSGNQLIKSLKVIKH